MIVRARFARMAGKIWPTILVALAAGCSGSHSGGSPTAGLNHSAHVQQAVREFIAARGFAHGMSDPEKYELGPIRQLPGGALLIPVWDRQLQPTQTELLVLQSGRVAYADFEALLRAHQAWPAVRDDAVRRQVIESIVQSHADPSGRHPAQIVAQTSDIPGYSLAPLEADVEAVVRPAWSRQMPGGRLIYVVYTYRRVGGTVARYRFEFSSDRFYWASHAVLGQGIGDWQSL